MLLAPFALADSTRSPSRRAAARRRTLPSPAQPSPSTEVPPWLVTWAVLGALLVLLLPSARGGDFGGATLPFWLAVAPWLDIAWLTRRRWLAVIARRPR
jgi:hypothetical protein